MDPDDSLPRRARDLVAELGKQDLDPLSVEELEDRIASLTAEIDRSRAKMERAAHHRASADSLFRR